MRILDLLSLSTRMFRSKSSRTFLTVGGMSIGIGVIIFMFSLGYGLQKVILEKIATTESLLSLDILEGESKNPPLNQSVVETVEKLSGVKKVVAFSNLTVKAFDGETGAELKAIVSRESFLSASGIKMEKGRDFKETNEIVITPIVAQIFGQTPEAMLGKELEIQINTGNEKNKINFPTDTKEKEIKNKYVVVGITKGNENLIYLSFLSWENPPIVHYDQLKVMFADNASMEAARKEISRFGLSVSSISDLAKQAGKVFGWFQLFLVLFGVAALIVSAIGMFNTMLVAFLERIEEIGIMKSIGASDFSIYVIFILESAIMGFLGGIGGVVLGFSIGFFVNGAINLLAERMGGESVYLFQVPLWFVFLIIFFSAFVGILTGIFPAKKASRTDPLDALRYK